MESMKLVNLPRNWLRAAFLIGVLALVMRIGFIMFYSAGPLAGSDSTAYLSFADGIQLGHGFHSTFEPWVADRPPLYSYVLAGVLSVFDHKPMSIYLFQSIVGAIATALFYVCASRLMTQGRATFAGLLFAVFPHFLIMTQQVLTESLYLSLIVLLFACLLLPKNHSERNVSRWLAVGVIVGLLALLKREALLPIGTMLLAVSYHLLQSHRTAVVRAALIVTAVSLIVITPWLVRNWIVLGSPVLSSSGGVNFMVGNNPLATGGYTAPPSDWAAQFAGLTELGRNQLAWKLSLGWVREHPSDVVRLLPRKLVHLWGGAHNAVLDGFDLLLVPLYLLAIVGIARKVENWKLLAALSLPVIVSITLIGLIFVGGWRYRLGVYPSLLLLAAYGVPGILLARLGAIYRLLSRREPRDQALEGSSA